VTLRQTEPYIEARKRQVLFREAVLAWLGVEAAAGQSKEQAEYCRACRASGRADCGNCNTNEIVVIQ
jgi:hypothetical protein